MSIKYRFFGIPQIFDEFVAKVKKEKLSQVKVLILDGNTGGFNPFRPLPDYYCRVELRAGTTRLPLRKYTCFSSGLSLKQVGIVKEEVVLKAFKGAIAIAQKLKDLGFAVTINGESIDKMTETVNSDIVLFEKQKRKDGVSQAAIEAVIDTLE